MKLNNNSPEDKKGTIGIQLHSIRDELKTNLKEALKKISTIGYCCLELANYENGLFYGYTAISLKKILEKYGLTAVASHVSITVWQKLIPAFRPNY